MRDEMLQPLIGRRIVQGQPGFHRLHRFAGAVVQKAMDVPTRAVALRAPAEAPGEAIEKLAESFEHVARCRH
jgi:hypothetical protein